jgi:hypothetical protein
MKITIIRVEKGINLRLKGLKYRSMEIEKIYRGYLHK